MNERDHRSDELWARLAAGDALAPDELGELLQLAERDPAWLDAAAADHAFAGLLATVGRLEAEGAGGTAPPFSERVRHRIATEQDRRGFVAAVERRLIDERGGSTAVSSASRPARWFSGRRALWLIAPAAAAVAVGIVLSVRLANQRGSSPPSDLVATAPRTPPLPARQVPPLPVPEDARELRDVDAPPGLVRRDTLLSFDFEGLRIGSRAPQPWRFGQAATCPPGRSGRVCLVAERHEPRYPSQIGVSLGGKLFTFSNDLYLKFDYWVGETTAQEQPILEVNMARPGQPPAMYRQHAFRAGPSARWNRVIVPLRLVHDVVLRQGALAPGDSVTWLQVVIKWTSNDLMIVDDFEVVRFAAP